MTTEIKAMHTPGPWHTEKSGFTQSEVYVYSEMGKAVASTIAPDFGLNEQEANARLIASAPDLLEALKKLVDCFEPHSHGNYEPLNSALGAADDAIAKAKGR